MSRIVVDVSISLDGFAAGPIVSNAAPMGEGGEALHAWLFAKPANPVDSAVREAASIGIGAAIVGRRTYDIGLPHWGGTPWANTPTFVVTHRPLEGYTADNGGTFAFGELEEAVRSARQAAGSGKVMVLGPGVSRQLLSRGDLDEIHLHIVPVLLGAGTRLFDGEQAALVADEAQASGSVTHLRLRVSKP